MTGDRFARKEGHSGRSLHLEPRHRSHGALHQGMAVRAGARSGGDGRDLLHARLDGAYQRHYHTTETRSRAIGGQSSIYAGTVSGGRWRAEMAIRFGWQSPFWVFGLAGMTLGIVVRSGFESHGGTRRRCGRRVRRVFRKRSRRCRWERSCVSSSRLRRRPADRGVFRSEHGGICLPDVMPTFLKEKFKLDLAFRRTECDRFIAVASMIGCVMGGIVADRWSRWRPEGAS